MDGTVTSARVEPAAAHRHRPYHVLRQSNGPSICWHWDRRNGLWARGGQEYRPERLAADGWVYDAPMIPEGELASASAVAATTQLSGATIVNVNGQAVAVEHVPGRRLLEHQTVQEIIAAAAREHQQLVDFKARAFSDVETYKTLLFATYNARVSGRSGGLRLESFDGLMRVEVSSATTITFGTELNAAKSLVDECLESWLAEGANEHLRAIVMDAFKVGEGGNYSADRVLRLRQFDIPDERWHRAMKAIDDAKRAAESRRYIRFYQRETSDGEWKQIVLDASRV